KAIDALLKTVQAPGADSRPGLADALGTLHLIPQPAVVVTTAAVKGRAWRRPLSRRRWTLWVAGAAALPLALSALVPYIGPTIVRVGTNKGVLVIDADDADIVVTVDGQQAIVIDKKGKREFTLTAGEQHEIEVRELPDGIAVRTRQFRLERNRKV